MFTLVINSDDDKKILDHIEIMVHNFKATYAATGSARLGGALQPEPDEGFWYFLPDASINQEPYFQFIHGSEEAP